MANIMGLRMIAEGVETEEPDQLSAEYGLYLWPGLFLLQASSG